MTSRILVAAEPTDPVPAAPPRRAPADRFGAYRIRIVATRLFLALMVALVAVSRSAWLPRAPLIAPSLLTLGLGLVGACMVGRLWCSLYIAGYKDKRLLLEGPYSICRHPLYFFSFLGAVGVAMATGTLTIPLLVAIAFGAYYPGIMTAEEHRLHELFGAEFDAYQRSVPRFFPRWKLLRQEAVWPAYPAIFSRHLLSVVWFAPASGALVLIGALRTALHWPSLVSLY